MRGGRREEVAAAAAVRGLRSCVCAGARKRLKRRRRLRRGLGSSRRPHHLRLPGVGAHASGRLKQRAAGVRTPRVGGQLVSAEPAKRVSTLARSPAGRRGLRAGRCRGSCRPEKQVGERRVLQEAEPRVGGEAGAWRGGLGAPRLGPGVEQFGRRGRGGQCRLAAFCPQALPALIRARGAGGLAGAAADLTPDFGLSLPCRLSPRASGSGRTRSGSRASRTPARTAARRS